jgi:hypothetical protein
MRTNLGLSAPDLTGPLFVMAVSGDRCGAARSGGERSGGTERKLEGVEPVERKPIHRGESRRRPRRRAHTTAVACPLGLGRGERQRVSRYRRGGPRPTGIRARAMTSARRSVVHARCHRSTSLHEAEGCTACVTATIMSERSFNVRVGPRFTLHGSSSSQCPGGLDPNR